MKHLSLIASALLIAPCTLQAAPRIMIGEIGDTRTDGSAPVEVVFLNDGTTPYDPPERLSVSLGIGAVKWPSVVERAPGAAPAAIPPGGFAIGRYVMRVPAGQRSGEAITVSIAGANPASEQAAVASVGGDGENPQPPIATVSTKPERGNAFLGNISAYAPIYAVYGPGTDSDARLQLSLKYQLFGDPGAVGPGNPWENGIHLGFVQRMFWNLGADSSPFRSIDFMPEAFYLLPARPIAGQVTIGGQAGFRHESNGRGGIDSRSLNTFYVQPVATLSIGDYALSVGPRAWIYAGSLEDNPDIKRYRGNTGLFAEIGRDDGFRLTTTSRINLGNGKGAIDAELSYPLDRVIDSSLNLYLFGQAFAGYGENLLDYDRRVSRVRFGIGIVR